MEATSVAFAKRLALPWLACPLQAATFAETYATAGSVLDCTSGSVIVVESGRIRYLASVFAAIARGREVFLGNAQWGESEWAQAYQILPRNRLFLGDSSHLEQLSVDSQSEACPFVNEYANCIMIPTGGTGGRIKFAVHTWETLQASVNGYQRYWGGGAINAICPLPVCHIGGLMLALRTWMTGGQLWLADAKLEVFLPPPAMDLNMAHCSVVGTQLRRALEVDRHWLKDCQAVLVGGGPNSPELLAEARQRDISIHAAYGLTEAAATVALARIGADGKLPAAEVLPHWCLSIEDNEIGLLGEALFRGYWGSRPIDSAWKTGDQGYLEEGRLRVLGRTGRYIFTGGKKVDAALLECRLKEWREVDDAAVFGCPHPNWGEQVTAVVVTSVSMPELIELARERLMPEMRPKTWLCVPEIPLTANGKTDWPTLHYRMNSK